MSKKPIVGVIPLWDDQKRSIWMLPGYMDAIRDGGGIPIILPLEASAEDIKVVCDMCDGFLLTGGHDVDPAMYGEARSERCGVPNKSRDNLEREVWEYAIEHDTPLLGICRGIQLINALCSGTLYQDLPTQYPSTQSHQMSSPYNRAWHKVTIVKGTPLHDIIGEETIEVNSYHHQAIKVLGEGLCCSATSEDGLTEGVYMPNKRFIHAVQWHPEFWYKEDECSRRIVGAFISACRK